MMFKTSIISVLIASLLSSSVCMADDYEKSPNGYSLFTVKKDSVTFYYEYPAVLKGITDVDIYPQVHGTIQEICFEDGAKVSKDQELFIIDPSSYQAVFDKAVATMDSLGSKAETAKLIRDTNQALKTSKAIASIDVEKSRNEYSSNVAAYRAAQAELKAAQIDLERTIIRSPVDGYLGMSSVRVGTLVTENMSAPLVRVSDNSKVYAHACVSEDMFEYVMNSIHKTNPDEKLVQNDYVNQIQLRKADGQVYDKLGSITHLSGLIDPETGSAEIKVLFDNPDNILHSGGTGTLIVPLVLENQLVIPATATYNLQNKTFVYVNDNGKAKSVAIEPIPLGDGKSIVVSKGIKEGDVIIADGVGLVENGAEL